jgi:hypothetical protein
MYVYFMFFYTAPFYKFSHLAYQNYQVNMIINSLEILVYIIMRKHY